MLWLAVALFAGCATGDPPPEPKRETPVAFRNASAGSELPRPPTEWWREFGSEELDRLEDTALANNRDHRIAIARVAQAQAQAGLAAAGRWPNVDAIVRREGYAPAGGPGSVVEGGEYKPANRIRVGFRASYEADLWGKLGYAADSALALADASEFHRQTVALTLTSDLAGAYFDYLSFATRAAGAERGAQSRRRSLAALEQRMDKGDATSVEVAQLRVNLHVAEAAAAQFEQRRERAFNRIALLAGMGPADLKLAPAALERIKAPPVNTGLPSELLCRRPDVRRAEAQLRSADFDVRALRANLLPSFSLVTETGIGAQQLALLTGPNAFFYLLSATLAQTVFDGGRKKYQLENARGKHLEMLEQYAGALLTAVREVEDALAARRLTADQHVARLGQVSAARANYELNRRIYEAGAADRLALLDAEQRLFAAEELSEEALHDRMQAAIDLYKALGGGSRSEGKDPCAQ